MKLEKKKISNLILIIAVLLLLFTPVGFHLKVMVNRLLSFSPTELKLEDQRVISDYRWELISHEGQALNFDEEKGKVIVLNVWATWCPPCVAEMPSFQKLYDDYSDKVSFLFVAHDEKEKVSTFLSKKGYTLPVYYENSTTPVAFESRSIPITFVISKTGQIIVSETGAADWNSDAIRVSLDTMLAE
ncbi:TlpA disulfide reductase family protein [Cellulophaga sp. Hel_I_12]|uniref:TlpA family protein disulfide reductase n=1 Tax=Cellulophaga sp. Hel_I_12 TaxID=1249972 RepID=UPI0006454A70|nr:TlpA disulfide reductase family protein [Cellulophaga sp. Hel_I_12]